MPQVRPFTRIRVESRSRCSFVYLENPESQTDCGDVQSLSFVYAKRGHLSGYAKGMMGLPSAKRLRRNSRMSTPLVLPSRTNSAINRPVLGENLKPCPLNPTAQ